MRLGPAILLFFLIVFSIGVASAGDEVQINAALQDHKIVKLEPRVYLLEGPVRINSGNSLIGQPGTILRVSPGSSQWFTGVTGIISSFGPVENVLIESIEIDGSCDELPRAYANYAGDHDAERAIIINGYTNQFSKNIVIRNCKIYNCFSDAIHIRFAENVLIYNVFASNCQHSAIYFVCVISGLIQNCEIAGITSDCIRVESSRNIQVLYNVLFGYFGPNSNGAYQGGHNLVQVGDQGHSHGAGSDKPIHTENVEIAYNKFSGKHLNTIWVDAAGKEPTTNLYVHNNTFVDMPEIEIDGYSVDNPPSVERFENIFDLIRNYNGQTSILEYKDIISYDPVQAEKDRKAFFSPNLWLPFLTVVILLFGIRINLKAVFKW